MKITVHLRPGAREAKIEQIADAEYRVWVHAIPEKGRANAEMTKLLAEHFQVAKSAVRIILGKTAREKMVEILGVTE